MRITTARRSKPPLSLLVRPARRREILLVSRQRAARLDGEPGRPLWPMIIMRTPKGWTGPKEVDGLPTEGTWRSHQVPMSNVRENPEHLALTRFVNSAEVARRAALRDATRRRA